MLPGDGSNFGDSRSADQAIEYLQKSKANGQPFFIGCGFSKPHSPPAAPQKFYDLYDVDKIPLPVNFAPRPTVPEGFPKMSIRPRNADLFIGRDASPEEARQMIRAYLASTSFVDFNVGGVMAEVDKLGLRENTIIIFWGITAINSASVANGRRPVRCSSRVTACHSSCSRRGPKAVANLASA